MSTQSISPVEYFVDLPVTRLRVSARIWNADHTPDNAAERYPPTRPHDAHIVLIHGWLDNSASWDRIAPMLIADYAQSDLCASRSSTSAGPSKLVCYCLELTGHGNSDHRSQAGTYHPSEHAIDMIQAIRCLSVPDGFFLCGHSLGGAIAYIMSTSYGNRLGGLVMMDSIGPWSTPTWMAEIEDPSIIKLAAALQEQPHTMKKRLPKLYPTREAILTKYVAGNPFMEESSAVLIGSRAVKEVYQNVSLKQQVDVDGDGSTPADLTGDGGGWQRGWVFKHDSRLISTALMTPNEESTRQETQDNR